MRAGKQRAFELDRRPIGQPSKFQRRQAVCGEAECQRRRRADYHRVGNSPPIPNTTTAAGTVPEMALSQSGLLEAVSAEEPPVR
jgi:hypothetical protein